MQNTKKFIIVLNFLLMAEGYAIVPSSGHPARAPGAPSGVTSSAGVIDTTVDVSWRSPVDTGGSPITGYTVTSSLGHFNCTTTGATNCTVSGLNPRTSYTFTVTAKNLIGSSPPSLATFSLAPFSLLPTEYTVPSAPRNVTTIAGDGKVTLTWSPSENYGGTPIKGYQVNQVSPLGSASCDTTGTGITTPTTCVVTGLTNGTSYVFSVRAMNGQGYAPYLFGYSSSITPMASRTTPVVANPSVLTLFQNGQPRAIEVINNSTKEREVIKRVDTSALKVLGVTVIRNTCTNANLAPNGGACFIEIAPGSRVSTYIGTSTPCTTSSSPGTGLTPSPVTIRTKSSSTTTTVYVVSYGCQYQGGYLFDVDDTTPMASSIGGKLVEAADKASNQPWSPNSASDTIWGIDYSSTTAVPSPNTSIPPHGESASLKPGQLNCNAENDGACATNNIAVFYQLSLASSYPAGICIEAINSSGNPSCTSGACYTGWYLPSVCDLGPFGSNGNRTGRYPYIDGNHQACASSNSINNKLSQPSIVANFDKVGYWSSTEDWNFPQGFAWLQFLSSGTFGGQNYDDKVNPVYGVRCVRNLTI